MGNFIELLKKDLLEIKRSKKWIISIVAFVLLAIISAVSAKILPELMNMALKDTGFEFLLPSVPSIADSYLQFIANIGEMGLILIIVMSVTYLIKEKLMGTYYTLKNNNVDDSQIVLSHFISKLIMFTISYLASIIVFVSLNLILFNEYAGIRGVVSLFYIYLTIIFSLSLSLFVSSICRKKSSGYALGIVLYFILTILSGIPYIDKYNPLYCLNLANDIMMKSDYVISEYIYTLSITLIMSIVLVVSSIVFFKNKINNKK